MTEASQTPVRAADVTLERVEPEQAAVLSRLIELYVHDLSDVFDLDVGANGRFGYDLAPYWNDRENRLPLFIRLGAQLGGFALVKRGSPVTADPNDLDLAEFFVLRRYRRANVGRHAVARLWDDKPGDWVVRCFNRNLGGLRFWRTVIPDYTRGAFRAGQMQNARGGWTVFTFRSPQSHART